MSAPTSLRERLSRIDMLYLTGLFLAVGGCNSVFVFEGWLLWASVPLYLAGLLLVWLSGTNPFNRMLALLLPAVVMVSLYTVTGDDRVREPAVWLVPEGYTGPLRMFLKEKCGAADTLEGSARLYVMDGEGMGYSAQGKNFGIDLEPHRFHWVRPDGSRIALRNFQEPADTLLAAVKDSSGSLIYGFPDRFVTLESDGRKIHLDLAFVGTYRQYLDHLRNEPAAGPLAADLSARREEWVRQHCPEARKR